MVKAPKAFLRSPPTWIAWIYTPPPFFSFSSSPSSHSPPPSSSLRERIDRQCEQARAGWRGVQRERERDF